MDDKKSILDRTIESIADAVIRDAHRGRRVTAREAASVAAFLSRCHRRMPDFMRLGVTLLTLAFAFTPVLQARRPFYRMTQSERRVRVRAWRDARASFKRDLIRFYQTLTLFGLYSELYREDYARRDQEAATNV